MGRPMTKHQQRKFATSTTKSRKDPNGLAKRTKIHTPKSKHQTYWPDQMWYDEEDLPGRDEEETE